MSDEINYLDFEITIQKAGKNEYIVRAESGDGEAETRFTNPFNEDKRALIDATLTKVARVLFVERASMLKISGRGWPSAGPTIINWSRMSPAAGRKYQ